MFLKINRLAWVVQHPQIVLGSLLRSAGNRDPRMLWETLSLFASEMMEGMETEGYTAGSSDSAGYQPTYYHILPLLLRYLGPDDTFVDVGCGKGRVLWFIATRRRLRKAIGIEIEPELAQIARENMKKARLRTPVTITEADASQVDLSEGTVYYLYNPFGRETLLRFLGNIERSLQTNPRVIRIVYLNPKLGQILDDANWLHRECDGYLRVWKNQGRFARASIPLAEISD